MQWFHGGLAEVARKKIRRRAHSSESPSRIRDPKFRVGPNQPPSQLDDAPFASRLPALWMGICTGLSSRVCDDV